MILQQLASLAGNVLSEKVGISEPDDLAEMVYLSAPDNSIKLQPFYTTGAGNFPYYYLDPNTLLFNSATYNWINTLLKNNIAPIQQGTDYFTNSFISALSSVNFFLSTADLAALSTARNNATNQQMALLQAWRAAFGKLPAPVAGQQPIDIILNTVCTTWTSPATDLIALQNSSNISLLLNNVPASGKAILPCITSYIKALDSAVPLINASSMNYGYLRSALVALQTPTAANGGIEATDQNIYPAYAISTPLQDIINGLNDPTNTIVLNMTITKQVNGQVNVSLTGGASYTTTVNDLFAIVLDNYANYFADIVAMSTAPIQMQMTFTGVTMVNFGPTPFNMSTGQNWYWTKPITDAIKNGTGDVSGFKFSPNPGIDFSNSGSFGYLSAIAISNQPTIKIIATSVNAANIQATLQQSSSVKLSFLNTLLGGETGNYDMNCSSKNAANGLLKGLNSVVIDSVPSPKIATDPLSSVAWVHGVITQFPAATPVSLSLH